MAYIDSTLAYARMSGRGNWAISALVKGLKFRGVIIAVGERVKGRRRRQMVVVVVKQGERWVERVFLCPSHGLQQSHGWR